MTMEDKISRKKHLGRLTKNKQVRKEKEFKWIEPDSKKKPSEGILKTIWRSIKKGLVGED